MESLPENGMVHLPSPYSVAETVLRLENILARKGLTLFARIDHAAGAKAVGLTMPPAQVLIFGNAKAGTPLMVAAPTSAIDLPLKALAWEDAEGNVRLSYNSADYLAQRHRIPAELLANIRGLPSLLEEALR
jgi:uncharacterized protein (DUF302 family)